MSNAANKTYAPAPIKEGGMPSVVPGFGPVDPVNIRALLMLEVAKYLMVDDEWPYRETTIQMQSAGDELGVFRFFGANHPDSIRQVFERKLDISIMNPSVILSMAHRGVGPYDEPMQVALIAVMPHDDQLGFAVSEASGLTSLDDIREKRYPLRLSVRGSLDHSTTELVEEVLNVHGFGYADIVEWGGSVSYDQQMPPIGFPNNPSRIELAAAGHYDAIFEEGVFIWVNAAVGAGLRFLDIAPERLAELQRLGFAPAKIEKSRYTGLAADVTTVDFSGWPIYARADAPDLLVRKFCQALEVRKDSIPWNIGPVKQQDLPLQKMLVETPETPQMGVPFHPAAKEFWTEMGYLK
ncbi:hypothetical protein Mycsm_01832 [Mycobacterium sp. JS623]|uniref:TAXI family TRAP transporter solute-binding subunit n=1 Tax=Mycobacterium sp. JS623 TaxID=212767 RepID=UPI0002A59C2A|nr:TAXI family TRAP transporter solute-binding subunit [Mycobacterium sp. JS623]AGB22217.1 hypothetical protein Mycsm_01832 [Mycobacterium sp. JS623]